MVSLRRSVSHHEAGSTAEAVAMPANRSFGLVVGGILAGIGALRIFLGGHDGFFSVAALALGALLVILGLLMPRLLTRPNRWWMGLGALLGAIMTPLVMGLVYITTFVPIGLAMRLAGQDPLGRSRRPDGGSYWIHREPDGPARETMKNQF